MKKQLQKGLAFLMVLMMVSVLGGCKDKQTEGTEAPTGTGAVTPVESETLAPVVQIEDISDYVVLGEYMNLEVVREDDTITDEDIEAAIKYTCDSRKRPEKIMEGTVADGDTVGIHFEGKRDGVAFEGGKAENYSLKIGSGQFVPGFEEALIGLSAGEEKDIDVTFPENYTPELAGKPVVFKCKIHEVKENVMPEIDDEFAKDVSEFDTMDELRADIRAKLTKSRQDNIDRAFENACVEKAAANMTAEIPACMVDEQVDKHLDQFAYQLQMSGMTMEDYTKMMGGDMNAMRQSMRPMAETTVRSNVLLSAVVDAEGIEVSDEEVEEELKQVAEQYQMELDQVKAAVSVENVKADLAAKKAVKLIVDNAVAVDVAKKEEA